MPRKKKTVKVVSIGNVKCDGEYHRPGKEWDCPHDYVGQLEEVGAVERIRMISEKKAPVKPKNTKDKPGTEENENDPDGSGAQDKDIPNDGTGSQE